MVTFNFKQSYLGDIITDSKTNVDLVFLIDATISMSPIIETVKNFALSFHEKIEEGLKAVHKSMNQLRVKVIVFRDYYCDGDMALSESEFFYLPEDATLFRDFVDSIQAKGGGDVPESSLEALAVAMRSDWVKEGSSKRHAIVLFTDAPAHPLEQQKDGIPNNYPSFMFKNLKEMEETWNVPQSVCDPDQERVFKLEPRAKRLLLFAPDIEPWNYIKNQFEESLMAPIALDNGGAELDMSLILNMICKSIK